MNTLELHDLFGALAEKTRLRILMLLSDSELCVCDLTFALKLPQSTVSRHMSRLKLTGIVTDRRAGKWVHYSLNRSSDQLTDQLFAMVELVKDEEPYISDRKRLNEHHNAGSRCQ